MSWKRTIPQALVRGSGLMRSLLSLLLVMRREVYHGVREVSHGLEGSVMRLMRGIILM